MSKTLKDIINTIEELIVDLEDLGESSKVDDSSDNFISTMSFLGSASTSASKLKDEEEDDDDYDID